MHRLQDEFDDIGDALNEIDENNSGRVSEDEWTSALEEMQYPDMEEAALAFRFADSDNSGNILIN